MAEDSKGRILMVSITPFKGGGETHAAKLAELLRERYEIHAIVSNPWLQEQMKALGISVTETTSSGRLGRYISVLLAIFKECLSSRPAVVHLNGQGEAYFSPIFRLLGIKTVIARHTPLNIVSHWLKRALVVICHRLGTKIVCVSSLVLRDMEKIARSEALVSIPNWLRDKEISHARDVQAIQEPFRLLFVGRLVESKGARDLIEAMKHVEGCSLEILGDGPQREELENRTQGLPVVFRGMVDNCTAFYDAADLLVFPSHFEGQGLAPLEAMARGLPCLLSDIEAAQETSDNGRVAALFHSQDVEDLAHKIGRLQDPSLLSSLSRDGFQRVKDSYSIAVVRPQYFKLFDELARVP